METVSAQAIALVILAVGFWWNGREADGRGATQAPAV
jgi:hypothetical protein